MTHDKSAPKGDREDVMPYRTRIVVGNMAVIVQVLPTHEVQVRCGDHIWTGTADEVAKILPKQYIWGILPQLLREVCEALSMAVKVIGHL